jgi:hypothetical protein
MYSVALRSTVAVKGKGTLRTFWLLRPGQEATETSDRPLDYADSAQLAPRRGRASWGGFSTQSGSFGRIGRTRSRSSSLHRLHTINLVEPHKLAEESSA